MAAVKNGYFRIKETQVHLVMRSYLKHPLARHLDIDSPEATSVHAEIINDKPFLQKLYREWCQVIKDHIPAGIPGPVVELGSGSNLLKSYLPGLISSDVLMKENIDIILDGRKLPFKDNSLKSIVMIDVFHHIPDAAVFLKECSRTLKAGGNLIMIEPWVTKWSSLIYRNLHHEPFLPEATDWSFPETGPLSSANLALPWIVCERDRNVFISVFEKLEIELIKTDWPFLYLLSGGVSMKCLVPSFSYALFRRLELLLGAGMQHLAMFATIVIRKKFHKDHLK